MYIYFIFH